MKKRFALLLSASLVASMILGGCASDPAKEAEKPATGGNEPVAEAPVNPAADRGNAKDTLVVGTPNIKGEVLPVYYSTSYDGWVVNALFDGLVDVNKDGEYVPMIAESMELSDDHKTYTIKLREGIKFTNGDPLTTKDVKFTYQVLADPSYDGRYFQWALSLEGGNEYKEGKADNIEGIKIIDDRTMTFTFAEAKTDNVQYLEMGILPESVYGCDYNNTKTIREKMNNFEVVGSGPYKLVKFEPTQYVEFVRNDDYFMGQPKTEKVIYKMVTVDTQMAEIEKGEIDVLMHVAASPANFAIADKLSYVTPNAYTGNSYGYFGFNMRDGILKDKKVRQALTYGFDREVFIEKYYAGRATVINVPFSPVNYAYTDELKSKVNKYKYDKDKAIALLEEAGWTVGSDGIREKDGQKLSLKWLTYTDSKYVETLIPMLKAYWKQIGAEVIVEQMEFGALVDKVYVERDFQMYNMAWSLDVLPTGNEGIFHSRYDVQDGNNSVGFNLPESDKLLDDASKEFDKDAQLKIVEDWALLFNEELPYMIISNSDEVEFVNERVENFNTSSYITIDDIIQDITIK